MEVFASCVPVLLLPLYLPHPGITGPFHVGDLPGGYKCIKRSATSDFRLFSLFRDGVLAGPEQDAEMTLFVGGKLGARAALVRSHECCVRERTRILDARLNRAGMARGTRNRSINSGFADRGREARCRGRCRLSEAKNGKTQESG